MPKLKEHDEVRVALKAIRLQLTIADSACVDNAISIEDVMSMLRLAASWLYMLNGELTAKEERLSLVLPDDSE